MRLGSAGQDGEGANNFAALKDEVNHVCAPRALRSPATAKVYRAARDPALHAHDSEKSVELRERLLLQ
jgi:hypothetical protein